MKILELILVAVFAGLAVLAAIEAGTLLNKNSGREIIQSIIDEDPETFAKVFGGSRESAKNAYKVVIVMSLIKVAFYLGMTVLCTWLTYMA